MIIIIKILGSHQADEVKNNVVKEKTQSEYKIRLRMFLKSTHVHKQHMCTNVRMAQDRTP